jgi:hypothetical protein
MRLLCNVTGQIFMIFFINAVHNHRNRFIICNMHVKLNSIQLRQGLLHVAVIHGPLYITVSKNKCTYPWTGWSEHPQTSVVLELPAVEDLCIHLSYLREYWCSVHANKIIFEIIFYKTQVRLYASAGRITWFLFVESFWQGYTYRETRIEFRWVYENLLLFQCNLYNSFPVEVVSKHINTKNQITAQSISKL